MTDLETLLREAQGRFRPPGRITHPLVPDADNRSVTEKLRDWMDRNDGAILLWALVGVLVVAVVSLVCLFAAMIFGGA